MSERLRLLGVNNADLLAGLSRLVQRGNQLTAEVLAHLAELEERRLHLQLGFPSLFAYCVEAHGLSEGAAGRRVAAARVCRRFPAAFELVARGELHLSALCGLAPHLNAQNATELLTACCRKTRRQVDQVLAARFPKPDVRDQIRRLPLPGRALAAGHDLRIPGSREEATARASVAGGGHGACGLETARIAHECGHSATARVPVAAGLLSASSSTSGSASSSTSQPTFGRPPEVPAPPPLRRRELEALSADRFGVHFTADPDLLELLERARALASHRLAKSDISSLVRLVLSSFVRHEEARRFAVGRKPRRAKGDATREQMALRFRLHW